jgi:hypothetical protein
MKYQYLNRNSFDTYLLLIVIFLPLLFIGDGLSKFYLIDKGVINRISLFIRILFEITIIAFLLKNINEKINIYLSLLALLFIVFVVGQFLIENENNFIENFISFNKYIYIFLVFLFFQKILRYSVKYQKKIYNLLILLFMVNIIFVLLGVVFEISFFKSFYDANYRFGYNGVFLAGNESSFVLISMISLLYFRAFYENGSKILVLLSIVASLLSGMKAVYAFILLLSFFHIFYKMKKINFLLLIPIILYGLSVVWEYLMSNEFQLLISFFMKTLETKGLIHMLLSGRNEILVNESILVLDNWNFLNFLFGGRDVVNYIMEMDFFDLVLFFGAFGTLVYCYLFYKSFIQELLWHNFFTFFIFSILTLSFLGGHFLTSPTAAMYFTLVILYFQNYRIKQYAKNTINK